jgi:hypothetical protein
MSHIEIQTREAIIAFLPGAIAAALLSYSRFLEEQATKEDPTDAKNFKAHHDACKVAIAHIELLVKLANSICLGVNKQGGIDNATMARLLMSAQAEIDEGTFD